MPSSVAAASSSPSLVQLGPQERRDFCPAKPGEFRNLCRAQDRNDSGYERHAHAEPARQIITEFKVIGVVKEQLGQDKIRAGVHLLLQMTPVGLLAFLAGRVAFGKTGDPDGKITRFPG